MGNIKIQLRDATTMLNQPPNPNPLKSKVLFKVTKPRLLTRTTHETNTQTKRGPQPNPNSVRRLCTTSNHLHDYSAPNCLTSTTHTRWSNPRIGSSHNPTHTQTHTNSKNQPPTTNHNLISSDEPNPGQTTGSNNWLHTKYQRAWTLKPWAVNHFWFQTPNPRNTPNVMFHTPNAVQHFLMRRSQQIIIFIVQLSIFFIHILVYM